MRRSDAGNVKSYFLAGRSMPWFAVRIILLDIYSIVNISIEGNFAIQWLLFVKVTVALV